MAKSSSKPTKVVKAKLQKIKPVLVADPYFAMAAVGVHVAKAVK